MTEVVFAGASLSHLFASLLEDARETCAVVLARVVYGRKTRLLANEVVIPKSTDYSIRNENGAQLTPNFVATVSKRAEITKQALIFFHTHPSSLNPPSFSKVDLQGERVLSEFFSRRLSQPALTVVVSEGGANARIIGSTGQVQLIELSDILNVRFKTGKSLSTSNNYDRQVRVFGRDAQKVLEKLHVSIVGLGGTGSLVLQQLAYLGVRNFTLIDPDIVQRTNLNRLVGASNKDLRKSKVAVAKTYVRRIQPRASVIAIQDSVNFSNIARKLLDSDFIFCCTDSHGSRAVIGQLAYQYLIPCIDMGVLISAKNNLITHLTGRIQMLSPTLGCLTCGKLLDPDAVRHDLMTAFERKADPYFVGHHEPQPAVISLNSTVASLAVTMFLAAVAGVPNTSRYLLYNGITGMVRPVSVTPENDCVVCSLKGALGKGEEWPLPARK